MPGCLLMPIFIACGIFWVFGPDWSCVPFLAVFGILTAITLVAGPSRVAVKTPSAAQSTSGTYSLTMILSIGIGVGLFFKERYWELIVCLVIFLISGFIWPRLRTLGPL